MSKALILTFWILVGIFLVVLSELFIPVFQDLLRGSLLFLVPIAVFFSFGVALIVLTLKERIEGASKKFLLLTGASAAGFFVFVFLHNAFYAISTVTGDIMILNYLIEGLGVVFFITAVFICSLGFLTGMVGSIVLFIKKRKGWEIVN